MVYPRDIHKIDIILLNVSSGNELECMFGLETITDFEDAVQFV